MVLVPRSLVERAKATQANPFGPMMGGDILRALAAVDLPETGADQ